MTCVGQGCSDSSNIYLFYIGQRNTTFHLHLRSQGLPSSSLLYQVKERSKTVSAVNVYFIDVSNSMFLSSPNRIDPELL